MFEFLIETTQAVERIEVGDFVIEIENVLWWPYFYGAIKYFMIGMTVLFIVGIVLILMRVEGGFKIRIREAIEEAKEAGKLPKTKTQNKREVIASKIESKEPDDYKEAVVLAENLFANVLKAANFSGDNIEKKLSKIPDNQLEFKEDIIWASKLKEKILADENFTVDYEEAKRAVYIFQRALKEIGVI
ncbi:MAG: hypothetical protein KAQ87_02810 [Candidatus Pacebacteria bacterium]|nr:hypothetical protein [Candidatus Paceibacterota bacterium]